MPNNAQSYREKIPSSAYKKNMAMKTHCFPENSGVSWTLCERLPPLTLTINYICVCVCVCLQVQKEPSR